MMSVVCGLCTVSHNLFVLPFGVSGRLCSVIVVIPRHLLHYFYQSGPEVIKHFSCSTQLSMKFVLLIILKLLIVANSFLLNIAEHENSSANKYENANSSWHFHIH